MLLLPLNLILLVLDLTERYSKGFEVLATVDLMYMVFVLAVLSIYNARIYKDGVQRPVFIVDWKYSFLETSHA
jgi:hypothetical protein